jgi:excinuclease ABC subunit C
MAEQNAGVQIENFSRKRAGSLEQRAADDGAKLLEVDSLNHIVCFDMAQLQGEERVGASVVMRNGRPAKKDYRTYIVKGNAMDDLRMMREVVERWLKRQEQWPDLLLIDGGHTHLDIIENLLLEHGLSDRLSLGSLAKREETLSRPNQPDLILDSRGRVLVHARDEAHRFVNNFHRKRRSRKKLSDPLIAVKGLGAKKFQSLLRHFGGRQGIQHASVNELQITPGIGKSLAMRIYEALH